MIGGDGNQQWYEHGNLHRDGDLPAVIEVDGTLKWFWRGKAHRDGDLPAIIRADGTQEHWQYGLNVTARMWSDSI